MSKEQKDSVRALAKTNAAVASVNSKGTIASAPATNNRRGNNQRPSGRANSSAAYSTNGDEDVVSDDSD
jgi:hypothetical protein